MELGTGDLGLSLSFLPPSFPQKFAAENQLMFAEMSLMTSEIKQIEGKVIEISRLQEIFSEKVLDQVLL